MVPVTLSLPLYSLSPKQRHQTPIRVHCQTVLLFRWKGIAVARKASRINMAETRMQKWFWPWAGRNVLGLAENKLQTWQTWRTNRQGSFRVLSTSAQWKAANSVIQNWNPTKTTPRMPITTTETMIRTRGISFFSFGSSWFIAGYDPYRTLPPRRRGFSDTIEWHNNRQPAWSAYRHRMSSAWAGQDWSEYGSCILKAKEADNEKHLAWHPLTFDCHSHVFDWQHLRTAGTQVIICFPFFCWPGNYGIWSVSKIQTEEVKIEKSDGHRTIVNEDDFLQLILRSYIPQALQFKRRTTHEVLPRIRKTGEYISVTRQDLVYCRRRAGHANSGTMLDQMARVCPWHSNVFSGFCLSNPLWSSYVLLVIHLTVEIPFVWKNIHTFGLCLAQA